MKRMTVAELKRQFSTVLDDVRHGESVIVEYGRHHEGVAVLIPIAECATAHGERPLGLLSQSSSGVRFADGFAIDDEALLQA